MKVWKLKARIKGLTEKARDTRGLGDAAAHHINQMPVGRWYRDRLVSYANAVANRDGHYISLDARSCHLAYAFLRLRPYRMVEIKCRADNQPNWKAIQALVERYGEGDSRTLLQQFAEWRDSPETKLTAGIREELRRRWEARRPAQAT